MSATGTSVTDRTMIQRIPKRRPSGPIASAAVTAPMPCAVTSTDVPVLPESSTLIAIAGTSAMNGAASSMLRLIVWMTMRSPGSARTNANAAADRGADLLQRARRPTGAAA